MHRSPCLGFFRFTVLALFLAFLTGCGTRSRYALPSGIDLPQTKVVVGNDQAEIETEIIASNMTAAMGGGLLFAVADGVINKNRANEATAAVAEVRDALIDLEFNAALEAALRDRLNASGVVPVKEVVLESLTHLPTREALLAQWDSDVVMLVDPFYALRDEFRSVRVSLEVSVIDHAGAFAPLLVADGRKGAFANALFHNTYTALISLPVASSDLKENAPVLAENDGEVVKEALRTGIDEVLSMLVYDVGIGDEKTVPKTGEITIRGGYNIPGEVEIERDGRRWVRAGGSLYSVDSGSAL